MECGDRGEVEEPGREGVDAFESDFGGKVKLLKNGVSCWLLWELLGNGDEGEAEGEGEVTRELECIVSQR